MVKPAPSERTDSENLDEWNSTILHLRDFEQSNVAGSVGKIAMLLLACGK